MGDPWVASHFFVSGIKIKTIYILHTVAATQGVESKSPEFEPLHVGEQFKMQ